MPTIPLRHVELLRTICDLPTAPLREQHVSGWLEQWADSRDLNHWQDRAGNLYVEYRRGPKHKKPLIIEAHMDHPGFVAIRQRGTTVHAEFRGGVRPSHFKNATVRFLVEGTWLRVNVLAAKPRKNSRTIDVRLRSKNKIPVSALGMWDLPDASIQNKIFRARVCDDLAAVAAITCLFEELLDGQQKGHVIGMFDRGEEVGFAGVIAACQSGSLPGSALGARVIGLETSKALPNAKQGDGVVIRVGDRTGLFSAGFTHFLTQCAGHLADNDAHFKSQRKLMDAGMCNSTPFAAWGHDSAALCLPLGNYHNMHIRNDPGYGAAPTAGKSKLIASETIHLDDFEAMVQLLLEVVKRLPTYRENFAEIKKRLLKMHREEHLPTLYQSLAEPKHRSNRSCGQCVTTPGGV